MPAVAGVPAIIELISAAVAAAGTGVSMYEGAQQRDQAKAQQAAALKAQQQQYIQQQGMARQQALVAAGPNAQAQTLGSLTGTAGNSFADLLAGIPGGNVGGQQYQPSTPGTPSAPTGQSTQQMGTQEMIARLGQPSQSNFSGGWNPTPETPYGPFQLSSFQTGG